MWANWLLCAAINAAEGRDDFEFTTDPTGGDGIIQDRASDSTWPTEHVYVPPVAGGQVADVEALVLAAIDAKNGKGGAAYAENKTLVVFIDAAGPWHPNRVLKQLTSSLHFDVVWLISLHAVDEGGAYDYDVVGLYWDQGNAPIWRVRIAPGFDAWSVQRAQ